MRVLIRLTITNNAKRKGWMLSGNEHSQVDKAILALQNTMPDWTEITMEMVKLPETKGVKQ